MRSLKNMNTGLVERRVATVCLVFCTAVSGMAAEPDMLPPEEISASRPSPEFEAAKSQAHRDDADPRAREWSKSTVTSLGRILSPLLQPCQQGRTSTPTITVVLKLNLAGKVTQALASDNSAYGSCVRKQLESLDRGSAPWDGYWNEIVLQGFTLPPPVLSVVEGSCKSGGEGPVSTTASIQIKDIAPAAGATVSKESVISLSVTYSVPANSGKYLLAVQFDSTTPNRFIGDQPLEFSLPAKCSTRGTFSAEIRPQMFWSLPTLGNPLKIKLNIMERGDIGYYLLATSGAMEYAKRDDGIPRQPVADPLQLR